MSESGHRLVRAIGLLVLGGTVGWLAHANRELRAQDQDAHPASTSAPGQARTGNAVFELELISKSTGEEAKSMLCLLDGKYGQVVQDGTVYNRNSHVDFDGYNAGSFTVGIQGGEEGFIYDMGPVNLLEKRYGGSPLEIFQWLNEELVVRGRELNVPDEIPSSGGTPSARRSWLETVLDFSAARPEAKEKAQVNRGHLYFIRIRDMHDGEEVVGLLQVDDYAMGRRVRVQGARL